MGRVKTTVDDGEGSIPAYRGYLGVSNRTFLDPELLSAVAIEKGPSSGAVGGGAIGGVVSMQTIGVDDIVKSGETVGLRIRGDVGGNSASPPAVGTRGGMLMGFNPSAPLVGAADGMDQPGLFDFEGKFGSVAAGYKLDNIDIVGTYVRRKEGNYFAGTKGRSGFSEAYTACSGCPIWYRAGGLTHVRAGEEVLNTSQDSTSYLLKGDVRLSEESTLKLGYVQYGNTFGELMPSVAQSHNIIGRLRCQRLRSTV
ncbi:Iron siderophore receptor protein [Hyphomicrobium sulfonivorans]|uniref:Iron siderophore receptor protein n=1 Tax=Hyphomicrobium sulfonivorans TaxID=121290 RepID=A0A109BBZ5_HYPSL|nr:Iron siderophore receptor protein [Hyphomicrobium sulfonivorans]